jgi:hypothetical protein
MLDEILKLCKSPIEEMFIKALSANVPDLRLIKYPGEIMQAEIKGGCMYVIPQWGINCCCEYNYIVDFYLIYYYGVPDFQNRVISRDGVEIPGIVIAEIKAVIECDGHEYHEKTKDQITKNNIRDRRLKCEGYNVFRFSGSELYNNADEAVAEFVEMVAYLGWK